MYKSYSTKTICFINMMHGCTWYYFFYMKLVTCMYELHIQIIRSHFGFLFPRSKGEGGILFYPCVCLSVGTPFCLSVCIKTFCHILLSNYSLQVLEILIHSLFRHGIYFCTNRTLISCLMMSVYFLSKFSNKFS